MQTSLKIITSDWQAINRWEDDCYFFLSFLDYSDFITLEGYEAVLAVIRPAGGREDVDGPREGSLST